MPELPEVETIKRGLERKIIGHTIKSVEILNPKSFQGDVNKIVGKKVVGVWRRAKMLAIDLVGAGSSRPNIGRENRAPTVSPVECTILIHLKMTGQLIWEKDPPQVDDGEGETLIGGHPTKDMENPMPSKSTRIIFEFDDPSRQKANKASGSKLYFNDQRKFGWIKIINPDLIGINHKSLIINRDLGSLGPEPLNKSFNWQILKKNLFKHPKTPIKVVLMDQSVVAGIGNIYASEALFLAGVDPRRKINTLSDEEIKKIVLGIKESLEKALKYGGSTRQHFVDTEGNKGWYLSYAKVYGRGGQPCKACGSLIIKISLGGRGTYYCPKCQQ